MDLPSDSDESDVDFVPDDKNCTDDDVSSDDILDETENDGGEERNKKGKKRLKQSKSKSGGKKMKNDNKTNGSCESICVEIKDDKKHEDDLWASFLKDPIESKPQGETSNLSSSSNVIDESINIQLQKKSQSEMKVNKDSSGDDCLDDKKNDKADVPIKKIPVRTTGGGLSSVLNKIGKNNKLSTLEKSKLDWNSFKRNEGIEEEISLHNRGREGYLDRQDFLERTDFRRFEIEKNIRATKRSNR